MPLDQYQEFKTKFRAFYRRNKSKSREVCVRIEEQTANLSKEITVRLEDTYKRQVHDSMESESLLARKYQTYCEAIYQKYIVEQ